MNLKYHAQALTLLGEAPALSEANLRLIERQEARHRFLFPASVREWYALRRSIDMLKRNSNDDVPVPLDRLGDPDEDWYGFGPRDFVAEGLLWIMTENQGVCQWAVRLDGSDDPLVLVQVEPAPGKEWAVLARSFSEFMFCQVWDHLPAGASCGAQDQLSEEDFDYLKRTFESLPTTTGWPGDVNYRLASPHGRILIWYKEAGGDFADWFLRANDRESLEGLLESVWKCGRLADRLYAFDEEGEAVLLSFRRP